jgi:hypothetical protein
MATADERGQIGRDIYTYLHLPIIAGIVLVAVGARLSGGSYLWLRSRSRYAAETGGIGTGYSRRTISHVRVRHRLLARPYGFEGFGLLRELILEACRVHGRPGARLTGLRLR